MRLENNNFAGFIPSSLSNLSQLSYLGLQSNKLEGHLPASIGNLQNFQVCNFSNNLLHGGIRKEMFGIPAILGIDLSSNHLHALLEAAALPSVFTLGKEPFALGKGFAECITRQSPLGKIFLGKGSLPSALYPGTRQNKKNFAECLGRHLAKYFRPLRRRPLTVILPSARPSTRQIFFYFF